MSRESSTTKRVVTVETLTHLDDIPPPVCSSARLAWDGFTLERNQVPDGASTPYKCYPSHCIGITLRGGFQNDYHVTGGWRTIAYRRGDIVMFPAHYPHLGHDPQHYETLNLHLRPLFVERAARDIVSGSIELVPQHKLHDPFLRDIGGYLLAEAEQGGASGSLYAESLATALAVHLVRNYTAAQPVIREYKGGITPHRLRRATDYINDNLAEDVSLADIADAVGMSTHHFSRTFRQATGYAPHTYLICQRIERAKQLLSETELPISQVALAVGFADQSHFSRVFRRLAGVTPKMYRER